jgi:hypothetical protein
MKAQRGSKDIIYSFFSLGARWGEVVNAIPRPLYPPDKKPDTDCTEGRVVPRNGLDGRVIFRPPLAFDPWTVKSVASCYTD